MLLFDSVAFNTVLEWLGRGSLNLTWWQIILATLGMTHITMISITVYLHRHQAHRSLNLHPAASHFFRFWLWLTTAQVTKEWVSIHRKHHAKCEQVGDPHSPHVFGIKKVLFQGAELYRQEANNKETLTRYGHGTPDDWIEQHIYSGKQLVGVMLMLVINVVLFGVSGLAVWAVQMMWTPITAAGIINGAAHYWGYRNFESPDASTNISPWGVLIAGEELHNNHHTYPTSAKLSVKTYEFDIGWLYISMMQYFGLAQVKKTPPQTAYGELRPTGEHTLEALITYRYDIMATYAKSLRKVMRDEFEHMNVRNMQAGMLKAAQKWMHRDTDKVPVSVIAQLSQVRAVSPVLDKMISMRDELRQLWLNTALSREHLIAELEVWCKKAEASGIAALQEFSMQLRSAHA